MKKVNFMGASTLILGVVLAFSTLAFKPVKNNNTEIWGRDAMGNYTNITQLGLVEGQDFRCDASDESCKLEYPINQDPNIDPTGGVQVEEDGVFVLTP
jgi:hypothetical protein